MDDDADLEAEIERELEQAEQERLATAAAKRRPKLLEVCYTYGIDVCHGHRHGGAGRRGARVAYPSITFARRRFYC